LEYYFVLVLAFVAWKMGNGAVHKLHPTHSDDAQAFLRQVSLTFDPNSEESKKRKELTRVLAVPLLQSYIFGDFRFVCPIGSGEFSKVYLAQALAFDGNSILPRYAIKEVPAGQMNKQQLAEFRYELNLLSHLQHPNLPCITSVYDCHGSENHLGNNGYSRSIVYVVMEYLNGGELLPALCKQRQYIESDALRLIRQLVSAVGYLHSQGVAHGSLLPENLILTQAGSSVSALRIVNFSRAECELHHHPSAAISSDVSHLQELRVPEVLRHQISASGYGNVSSTTTPGLYRSWTVREKMAMDVWCIGAMAHLLLSGLLPGEDGGHMIAPRIHSRKESNLMAGSTSRYVRVSSLYSLLLLPSERSTEDGATTVSGNGGFELDLQALRPRFRARQWMFVSDEAQDFLHEILQPECAQRPDLAELCQHEWLQSDNELVHSEGREAQDDVEDTSDETYSLAPGCLTCLEDDEVGAAPESNGLIHGLSSSSSVCIETLSLNDSTIASNVIHNDLTHSVLPSLRKYIEDRQQHEAMQRSGLTSLQSAHRLQYDRELIAGGLSKTSNRRWATSLALIQAQRRYQTPSTVVSHGH
jgi:serine/threonine protein kinase